ncbi:CCAAT/enhancer-binding protein gamma [Daktulosphaira vitifoliae]|uniref:CCAAT/enhancer-binding protein gamma n=1 Tax=Daktulosphaira vitifoliae TaxID=58002 RepID=UPI0021AA4775|nr:CCAAT/enhancer-binding protein gamma [Daktulosphaira vitifoliae]XP_050541504.1 CCAAT/enhancer-binding protein gamma [Daktulosphaira vitifoliae]XP_050541514.1 CCAAT/enhancer-binding protein gamma [Daktulosphaira vitifoliae]XP_050541521.1 CCAAT/enhancer-binding protein gamma [Daktulosphaira vitifoliae]
MARKNKENKSMALSSVLKDDADSSEDDYRRKRDKNNQAVKRSRVKSRMRTQQTLQRVNQLKTENDMLEEKIKLLSKELGFLKELFMAQAGTSQIELPKSMDLKKLLSDTTSDVLENETSKPSAS